MGVAGGTLSIVGAGQAHADVGLPLSPINMVQHITAAAKDRSATLPSPYRNKYEVPNVQIDSPVGLYNCPQQRTSQAFSSMDDLDALASNHHHHPVNHHLHPNHPPQPLNHMSIMTSSPTATSASSPVRHSQQQQQRQQPQSYVNHHLANHRHILSQAQAVISHVDAACSAAVISQQPSTSSLSFKANSLERSSSNAAVGNAAASRQKKFVSNLTNAAANRELPALPISTSSSSGNKIVEGSRSMEDLDALELLGVHGRSKMHYKEIIGGDASGLAAANGPLSDGLSRISVSSCSGIPHSHHLPNTEEYPTHHHPCSGGAPQPSSTVSNSSQQQRISVTSIASSVSSGGMHGQLGVPRGFAAMSAAAQAVLEPHQHPSHHQQHTIHHQHGNATHHHHHHPHHRDAGGPYPALSHRNSTLLPGQTYPEPSLAKPHPSMGTLQEVFYHREMRLAAAVAANLSPSSSKDTGQQPSTSHIQPQQQRASLASTTGSGGVRNTQAPAAPPPPPKQTSQKLSVNQGIKSDNQHESPPPLLPKQVCVEYAFA